VIAALAFSVGGARTDVQFSTAARCPEASLTVFDDTTRSLFGAGVPDAVSIPPGEKAKEWGSVEAVLEFAARKGIGRDGVMAGVGGGVVCDIAAFAASIYMRGCGLVLVPTTLLAMVDASLGGKTGIDFLGFKNLVGSFYPASRIIICPSAVSSLPEREYISGLAEVIKTAVIGDEELFELLERRRAEVLRRDADVVGELIRRSLAVKGRIVEQDPRENGNRAWLNLGHTFGHALESAMGFSGWTHGEAVAWGIGRALAAGINFGMTDAAFAARVRALLASYGYRMDSGAGFDALAAAFTRDKKRQSGRTRLVIPCGMGDIRIREATADECAAALSDQRLREKERMAP
jgi:3-dehydroquinate synthase